MLHPTSPINDRNQLVPCMNSPGMLLLLTVMNCEYSNSLFENVAFSSPLKKEM